MLTKYQLAGIIYGIKFQEPALAQSYGEAKGGSKMKKIGVVNVFVSKRWGLPAVAHCDKGCRRFPATK